MGQSSLRVRADFDGLKTNFISHANVFIIILSLQSLKTHYCASMYTLFVESASSAWAFPIICVNRHLFFL